MMMISFARFPQMDLEPAELQSSPARAAGETFNLKNRNADPPG
jgi:hypothetical protein